MQSIIAQPCLQVKITPELLKISMPRLHPKAIKSEPLGVRTRQQFFKALQVIPMSMKLETTATEDAKIDKIVFH